MPLGSLNSDFHIGLNTFYVAFLFFFVYSKKFFFFRTEKHLFDVNFKFTWTSICIFDGHAVQNYINAQDNSTNNKFIFLRIHYIFLSLPFPNIVVLNNEWINMHVKNYHFYLHFGTLCQFFVWINERKRQLKAKIMMFCWLKSYYEDIMSCTI